LQRRELPSEHLQRFLGGSHALSLFDLKITPRAESFLLSGGSA
jgi:hypothetical protein